VRILRWGSAEDNPLETSRRGEQKRLGDKEKAANDLRETKIVEKRRDKLDSLLLIGEEQEQLRA